MVVVIDSIYLHVLCKYGLVVIIFVRVFVLCFCLLAILCALTFSGFARALFFVSDIEACLMLQHHVRLFFFIGLVLSCSSSCKIGGSLLLWLVLNHTFRRCLYVL